MGRVLELMRIVADSHWLASIVISVTLGLCLCLALLPVPGFGLLRMGIEDPLSDLLRRLVIVVLSPLAIVLALPSILPLRFLSSGGSSLLPLAPLSRRTIFYTMILLTTAITTRTALALSFAWIVIVALATPTAVSIRGLALALLAMLLGTIPNNVFATALSLTLYTNPSIRGKGFAAPIALYALAIPMLSVFAYHGKPVEILVSRILIPALCPSFGFLDWLSAVANGGATKLLVDPWLSIAELSTSLASLATLLLAAGKIFENRGEEM